MNTIYFLLKRLKNCARAILNGDLDQVFYHGRSNLVLIPTDKKPDFLNILHTSKYPNVARARNLAHSYRYVSVSRLSLQLVCSHSIERSTQRYRNGAHRRLNM